MQGVDYWQAVVGGTIKAVRFFALVTQSYTLLINNTAVKQGVANGSQWTEVLTNVAGGTSIRIALAPVAIPGFSGLRSALVEVRYVS